MLELMAECYRKIDMRVQQAVGAVVQNMKAVITKSNKQRVYPCATDGWRSIGIDMRMSILVT
jgi:hypothetical protein